MSHLQLATIQNLLETIFDQPAWVITELGVGATSAAWEISSEADRFVLRTVSPKTNRPVTYQSEFVILRAFQNLGLTVPEPITNSFENRSFVHKDIAAWAITRSVSGLPVLKNEIMPTVASQIGCF